MSKKWIPGFALLIIVALVSLLDTSSLNGLNDPNISGADTAWMLAATGLVLLMTPGLSFFYGGMVSRKNVISTMLQSFICMGGYYLSLGLFWV
jgi:Amt family ammonium transporter